MRNFSAIFLLTVFACNVFGYKLVSSYFSAKAEEKLARHIVDKAYDDNELILIKKAVNLPYYNLSTNYESKEGSIEIEGTHYNFVKSRVVNDTLELLCLPNTEKTRVIRFEKHIDNYAANDTDPSNDKSKLPANSIEKKAFSDYENITYSPPVNVLLLSFNYSTVPVGACIYTYKVFPPKPPRV